MAFTHSIAVVGAGMAGLAAARTLKQHGLSVRVFDKGRRPGGRMSSRQREYGTFDLGAQYFTARDPDFIAFVERFERRGDVGRWPSRMGRLDASEWDFRTPSHPRYTGAPSMVALPLAMAADLDVQSGVRIEALAREGGRWTLIDQHGERHAGFDRVVLALPGPQARALITPWLGERTPGEAVTAMTPTWSVWAGFATRLPGVFPPDHARPALAEWQGVTLADSTVLRFASRNQTRPGQAAQVESADDSVGERISLLARSDWSAAHLSLSPEAVAERLIEALAECYPHPLPAIEACGAHRWRYAQPAAAQQTREGYLLYPDSGLSLCGDWCLDGRVEAAWLSGTRLARALIGDNMSALSG